MDNKEFREGQKVNLDDKNQINKIVKMLDDQLETYYPNNKNANIRTQTLRSGENIYMSLMMLTQIMYMIQKRSQGIVDVHVSARSKAETSQKGKENRPERTQDLRDILACTLYVDRVHDSPNFNLIFNNTTIQGLYSERKSNLSLMEMAIDFINNRLDDREIPSDLDHSELSEEERKNMKKKCDEILENIQFYQKEDEPEIHTNQKFPIKQYIRDMCIDLQNQRMELRKSELDNRIEELKNEVEKETNPDKRKRIQGFLDYCYNIRENVEEFENKNQTQQAIDEIQKVLTDKKLNLYSAITKHFEMEMMDEDDILVDDDNIPKNQAEARESCEILMAILYSLLKLEFKKSGEYQGSNYNKLWSELHNQLQMYKFCELDGKKYDNITFETIDTLLENLIQLNSQLSDKLQFEIAQYMLKSYNIMPFLQNCLGEDSYSIEVKNKTNGYLAIHYDFDAFEMKVTTHYRGRVMTVGSAAYVNGRDEHVDEKRKSIKDLNFERYLFKVAERDSMKFKKLKKLNELDNKLSVKNWKDTPKIKGTDTFTANFVDEEKIKKAIIKKEDPLVVEGVEEWRDSIFNSIPRFYDVSYNDKEDVVEVKFCSEAENIETVFKQTSVLSTQRRAKNRVKELVDFGIISDEPTTIKVKYQDCSKFFKEVFPIWRANIDQKLQNNQDNVVIVEDDEQEQ